MCKICTNCYCTSVHKTCLLYKCIQKLCANWLEGEIQFWGQTHTHTHRHTWLCTSRAASSQLKKVAWWVVVVVDQAITNPISGPSLSFVFCLLALSLTIFPVFSVEYLIFCIVFTILFWIICLYKYYIPWWMMSLYCSFPLTFLLFSGNIILDSKIFSLDF